MRTYSTDGVDEETCSIARSLQVFGDRWTLLVLREVFAGKTRFSEFRAELGVAPDVLAQRLTMLIDVGILEKRPYREATSRVRYGYHLTEAGEEMKIVLGAIQQWGDAHRAHPDGPLVERVNTRSGRPLRVTFVDDRGEESALADTELLAPIDPRE